MEYKESNILDQSSSVALFCLHVVWTAEKTIQLNAFVADH